MRTYDNRRYWARAAREEGVAPVLAPQAPKWLNDYYDKLQRRVVMPELERLLRTQGGPILEIGAGVGRWNAELLLKGRATIAVDLVQGMLSHYKLAYPSARCVVADGAALPFKDESFGGAFAVTVIQHLPPQDQERCLKEIYRCLMPGSYVFLYEATGREAPVDTGTNLFPHTLNGWAQMAVHCGFQLRQITGARWVLPHRILRRVRRAVRVASPGIANPQARVERSLINSQSSKTRKRLAFEIIGRIVWRATFAMEIVAGDFLPNAWADHGIILLRR